MSDAAIEPARAAIPRARLRLVGDDRLARLAAAGNRDAFAAIYARHHQHVYRYCRSILGNSEDAADALQSAMARALAALEGERREIALKPWLYRIAHNEAIRLLRRRRPQHTVEELEACSGPSLEATAEARGRLRQLVADLAELSERQRGALLMRELSGLTYAELAGAFDTSVDAAKQAVCEGRVALQELAEGRAMGCEAIRRSISDHDGRVLRGRRLRAHLRDCAACRDFHDLIDVRRRDVQALAPPLPATAAAAILNGLFGRGGDAGGLPQAASGADALVAGSSSAGSATPATSGLAGWLPGAASALGVPAAGKGLAAAAATLALAAGAAGVASRAGNDSPSRGTAHDTTAPNRAGARPTELTDRRNPRAEDGDRHAAGKRVRGREHGAAAKAKRGAAETNRPAVPGPPARDERRTSPSPPTPDVEPGERGASGGLPPAVEQYTDGRVLEQGSEAPSAQTPAAATGPQGASEVQSSPPEIPTAPPSREQ